jgi:hypothetical protein
VAHATQALHHPDDPGVVIVMTQDVAATTPEVTTTTLANGWSLVDYSPDGSGGYSLSVAPDGLIHLGRHITPEQVADFVTAVVAAVEVAHVAKAKADAKANEPPSRQRTPPAVNATKTLTSSIGRRGGRRGDRQRQGQAVQAVPAVPPRRARGMSRNA